MAERRRRSCARSLLASAALLTALIALDALLACQAPRPTSPPRPPRDAALRLYTQARVAWALGDAVRARDLLFDAALLEPGAPAIETALAEALIATGNEPEARGALARALATRPADADASLLLAELELHDHQLDQALARLLALDPQSPRRLDVLELLHPLLLYSGDPQRGLALFDAACEQLPGHAFLHEARADFLACLGREAEALAGYRRALALEPGRRAAERKAVRLLEEQGERILQRLHAPAGAGLGLTATPRAAASDR